MNGFHAKHYPILFNLKRKERQKSDGNKSEKMKGNELEKDLN